MTEPGPLYSLEAERALLGAVLIGGLDALGDAGDVRAIDFHLHHHRWIWDAVRRLESANERPDVITVGQQLEEHGQLSEVGGTAYLTQLIGDVPTSMHAGEYGKIVRR